MKTIRAKMCAILTVIGLYAVTAVSGQITQNNGPIAEKVEMKMQLAGAPLPFPVPTLTGQPHGEAQYTQFGPTKQFTALVSNMGLADGTTLLVMVDENIIGKIQIFNSAGKFSIDTQNGDIVPTMKLGSSVVITDPVGKTMLAGVF